jgi:hypothetical protein
MENRNGESRGSGARTGRGKPFLLVYNDRFKHIRTSTHDKPNPLVGDPALQLPSFLGAAHRDLEALHYANDQGAVFTRDKLFDEGAGSGFLTTAALAAILEQAGVPFGLIGEAEFDGERPITAPRGETPLAIGVSTTHLFDAQSVRRLVARIQGWQPGVPVILGGAGTTLNPAWFEGSGADYQVVGDGEEALPELVLRLRAGADMSGVPNLRWKSGGEVRGALDMRGCDMDRIPTPRPDLANVEGIWPAATFYESRRGCPYKCAFCSYPSQSPRSRHKRPERMAEEFAWYAARGVRFLACHDSSMLTPMPRMKRFCSLLVEQGSTMLWGCWGYPNELRLSLLEGMFRAGCRYVAVGVESAEESVLQSMQRPSSSISLGEGLGNVKAAGMLLSIQLLVGFPGETEQTLASTMRFLAQAGPDFYSAQPFQVRDSSIPAVRDPARYGLEIMPDESGNPTRWRHATMDSEAAESHVREMQTRIALDYARPFYHGLLRAGSPIGFLPPKDRDGVERFRRTMLPILKEWERALVFHADSSLGNLPADPRRFAAHKDRARRLLDRALLEGSLTDRAQGLAAAR